MWIVEEPSAGSSAPSMTTARTAESSGNREMNASALNATRGLSAISAPSALISSAGPGWRLQTATAWPAFSKFAAIGRPILPRPINPTFTSRPCFRGSRRQACRLREPSATAHRSTSAFVMLADILIMLAVLCLWQEDCCAQARLRFLANLQFGSMRGMIGSERRAASGRGCVKTPQPATGAGISSPMAAQSGKTAKIRRPLNSTDYRAEFSHTLGRIRSFLERRTRIGASLPTGGRQASDFHRWAGAPRAFRNARMWKLACAGRCAWLAPTGQARRARQPPSMQARPAAFRRCAAQAATS